MNSRFLGSIFWVILMILCIFLNAHTISTGIEKGDTSSIVIGIIATCFCVVALVFDIIAAADSFDD